MSTYIDSEPGYCGGGKWQPGHSWSEQAKRRLAFQYGPARAEIIMAGRDPKTQADITTWNNLGRRAAA